MNVYVQQISLDPLGGLVQSCFSFSSKWSVFLSYFQVKPMWREGIGKTRTVESSLHSIVVSMLHAHVSVWKSCIASSWLLALIVLWGNAGILVLSYSQPVWWQHDLLDTVLASASTFMARVFLFLEKSLKVSCMRTALWMEVQNKLNTNLCCARRLLSFLCRLKFKLFTAPGGHSDVMWRKILTDQKGIATRQRRELAVKRGIQTHHE